MSLPTGARGTLGELWMCQLISSPPSSSEKVTLGDLWDEVGLVDAEDDALYLSLPNLSLANDFAVCNGRPGPGAGAVLSELPIGSLYMIHCSADVVGPDPCPCSRWRRDHRA